ncbi:MAG: hypothetical protein AAGF95_20380, partial [Chloroflexota bacterium]
MTLLRQHFQSIIVMLSIGLLILLLIPIATNTTRANEQVVELAVGEQLVVTCATTLTSDLRTNEGLIACADADPTSTADLINGLSGIEDGGMVSGSVAIEADVSGDTIAEVVFDLTGPQDKTHTERQQPYYFLGDRNVNGTREPIGWDTTTYPDGEYQLIVTATDNSGQSDQFEVAFRVANDTTPAPTATNEPLPTSTTEPEPTATNEPLPTSTPEPPTEPTTVPEPPVGGNNLPASAATYLGGDGEDQANAVEVAPDGNVVMAGTMPNHNPGGVTPTELLGGGSGAIVRVDGDGQEVLSVTRIGAAVSDLEMNDEGQMAVCGDFGVATLNATASEVLWNAEPGSGTRCSIGADGTVAAIVGSEAQVYNASGDAIASWGIGGSFQEDIVVDSANNLIIATGFTNRRGGGNPVQVAFIKAWNYNGESEWTNYDFSGGDAARTSLMADTRGYRLAIGGDDKLYFTGESAGGNTIYGRDPKNIDENLGDRQVKTDNYTNPFNTKSNHITWYGRYNPANGDLEQGQIILTRLSSGGGNTIRPRGIDADVNGTVYVSGVAACCIADRDNQQLGGQAIGGYTGGESFLLVVSPDLEERLYWTPFPGGGDASVAVRNGTAALATTSEKDELV